MTSVPAGRLPLADGEALLVAGSQNWNPADRFLAREQVHSLQVVTAGGTTHLSGLEDLSHRGLRDVIELDDDRLVVTNGSELLVVDLRDGAPVSWTVDPAGDLHELASDGEVVVVPNTAFDELVVIGGDGEVRSRRSLARFRHASARPIAHGRPAGGLVPIGPKPVHADSFHVNQGHLTGRGAMLALVHHVEGYRPLAQLGHRLTRHGGGGVLDLDRGVVHQLGLRAPHSLRRHPAGGYALLDSGRGEAVRYDDDWNEVGRWSTAGWGRGLAIADDGRWFVGLSATRRRYAPPGEPQDGNWIVAFDDGGTELGRRGLANVEQVWSVRLVDQERATRMVERLATA